MLVGISPKHYIIYVKKREYLIHHYLKEDSMAVDTLRVYWPPLEELYQNIKKIKIKNAKI